MTKAKEPKPPRPPRAGPATPTNPTDRGKSGVKRSLLTEAQGIPVGLAVDGANRHDMKLVRETLDGPLAFRPAPSLAQPQGICLDKGYDFGEVRRTLDQFGFTPTSAAVGKRLRPSKKRPASKPGAGWWNALTVG